MAFQRPTLSEIIARVEGDINARVPDGDSRLRRSLLAVIARIVAGTAHGLYGFLDWLSRQIIADTAEDELLQTHASWWGVERILASPATGDVDLLGQMARIFLLRQCCNGLMVCNLKLIR